MQKIFQKVTSLIFWLVFFSCSSNQNVNQELDTTTIQDSVVSLSATPIDYSKFSYSLPNSNYVFQIEINDIETETKKNAFVHQDDQYSAKKEVDGYLLKVHFKITNPYDKVMMAPVPNYFYIGTLNKEYFSASTTFNRDCQCNIDNSAELTDTTGKSIYSLSNGRCGNNDLCVEFEPNETKEFIVTFTDPVYYDAKELIFSCFDRRGKNFNSARMRDIVLVLDIDKKKVVNEIQL